MNRTKFKELKITHRFLTESGIDVPQSLMQTLSTMIKEEEERRHAIRLEKMSDEDLAALDNKKQCSVRVTTFDGRMIMSKRNADTFKCVLNEVGLEELVKYNFCVGNHPVVCFDPTFSKTRMKGYQLAKPGYFVYKTGSSANIYKVLTEIDEVLQLNLEIELV